MVWYAFLSGLTANRLIAFFFIAMAMLMFVYMLCATRTNVVYVVIFFSLIISFALGGAAHWRLGEGNTVVVDRLVVVSPLPSQPWTMRTPNRWTSL